MPTFAILINIVQKVLGQVRKRERSEKYLSGEEGSKNISKNPTEKPPEF